MTEANKAVVQRFFDEVVNGRNLDLVDELFAPDFTGYIPFSPEPLQGPDAMKQTVAGFHAAFSDLRGDVEATAAEGDLVFARVTASGTNDGEMMGMEPTNKHATWSIVHAFRLRDSQVVEDRVHVDRLGLMEKLGHAPTPAG